MVWGREVLALDWDGCGEFGGLEEGVGMITGRKSDIIYQGVPGYEAFVPDGTFRCPGGAQGDGAA